MPSGSYTDGHTNVVPRTSTAISSSRGSICSIQTTPSALLLQAARPAR